VCPSLTTLHANILLDPSYLEEITNGKVDIMPDQYPNFLYDETVAEELLEDDPEEWDVELGLLRSPLCVWVSS